MRAPLTGTDPNELLSRDAIDDPHPFYARLRREHPISGVGDSGVHVVATWALIDEALQREEDFSANLTGVLVRGENDQPDVFPLGALGASHVIATADEPDHSVHRKLSQPRLAPAQIAELEDTLRAWTIEALTEFLAEGGGDFTPISERIPARAVAQVLGLPDADVQHFRTWAMMGGDILAGDIQQEGLIHLARETGRMAEYLREHFRRASENPRAEASAPLLEALAIGVRARKIDEDQAVGIATVMFGAGGESTAALIASTVKRLASDPELASTLRRDPSLIPRFIEEMLRLESPFKFHYRAVRRDCELGGMELHEGDRLMLSWASANRDPAIFESPDELRLDRRHPKQHMGFGRGPHFCIGAHLARLEARVVIEELLARTSGLALRPKDPPVYAKSIFIRRLERLPLDVR